MPLKTASVPSAPNQISICAMPAKTSYTTPTATALASDNLLSVSPSCSSNHDTTLAYPRDDLTFLANASPPQAQRTDCFQLTGTHPKPENTTVQNNSSTNGAKKSSTLLQGSIVWPDEPSGNSCLDCSGSSGVVRSVPFQKKNVPLKIDSRFHIDNASGEFIVDPLTVPPCKSLNQNDTGNTDQIAKSSPDSPIVSGTYRLPTVHDASSNLSVFVAAVTSGVLVHMNPFNNVISFCSHITDEQKMNSLSVLTFPRLSLEFCANARIFLRYKIPVPSRNKIRFNQPVPYEPPVLPLPPKPGGICVVACNLSMPPCHSFVVGASAN
jgi:hypothetical protein